MRTICVDFDGTLFAGDLLHESIARILIRKPWMIFQVLLWLIQGRCYLKENVARLAQIQISSLPFRREVVELITSEKANGAKIYLATAASQFHAKQIEKHFGIFDGVFCSENGCNLKGKTKADVLIKEFGESEFCYIGDSEADLPVWRYSRSAIVVGGSEKLIEKVREVNSKIENILIPKNTLSNWLKLLRVHQWAKNLIIFVPLVTSHQFFNSSHLFASFGAFFSLSFVASATYIINDLLDLNHDRAHSKKKNRPLASGAVGIPGGAAMAVILFGMGVSIAAFLPPGVWLCLAVYVAVTLAYSFCLKKIEIVDAVVLAGLYTLRLLIGHAATGVPISIWLLAFSIFLFFSLALVKRFVEIGELRAAASRSTAIQGRGYCADDHSLVGSLGVSCGVLSVLVLILYVNSPEVRILYSSPILLMLLAPIFLYWIGRVWLLASRGQMNEDPVLFALRDKASYAVGLLTLLVIFLASGGK